MKRPLVLVLTLLAFGVLGVALQRYGNTEPLPPAARTNQSAQATTTKKPATNQIDIKQHSLDAANSIWAVINKRRPLQPTSYVPADLIVPEVAKRSNITTDERQVRQETGAALQRLFAASSAQGLSLSLLSGYRSYGFQASLYNGYVSQEGQAAADLESARPGHSEHQTGLAADIGGSTNPACNLEQCFADTIEGKWLRDNAHTFGFIIRYPKGKTPVTGYSYEPWHLRYVGTELAAEMRAKAAGTMEEFFSLPPAPDYN